MTTEPETPTGIRGWLVELRRTGWIYPLAAVLLLVVVTDFSTQSPARIAENLGQFLLVACAIGLFITLTYGLVVDRILARVRNAALAGAVHLVTLTVSVGLGAELAIAVLEVAYDGRVDAAQARATMWRIGLGIGFAMMLASILYDRLRKRAREVELRAEKIQRDLVQAQLSALQARTNPHFLFNSLNTVASLVEDDPTAAVDAIERLSDLLRYALEGSRTEHVPLRRELDAIRDYLALEGLRFGDRLHYELDVDDEARDELVPPFILQPVVENAVKHGIASRRAGGSIRVRVRLVEGRLELSVEDDGPGQSDAPGTKTGHGDLVQRLALVYGGGAEHTAGPGPDGGYRVRLRLPRLEATG